MRDMDPATQQRHDLEVCDVRFEYKGKPCNHDTSMNPPKLRGQGCCSKLLLLLLCFISCTTVAIGFIAVFNLPIVAETRAALHQHLVVHAGGDASSHSEEAPKGKPLPAILRRFRTIERAREPGRGADRSTLDAAFPHWKEGTEVALADVALALSAVVEQIESSVALTTASPSTRPNTRYEEDIKQSEP